ncbi:hypothetical protein B0T10DRAFT_470698 [Thelonectria olida]|uniref:Uncharacterized protein n=1 Tax=Thelonectria olida TaxID=1576542 RepID=A0A9P8WGT3_9HYPO|nr:hypothetical protein B0T10DRAFT_470698 [Thelonectria olida]
MIPLTLLALVSFVSAGLHDYKTLDTPELVRAGESFTIAVNFSGPEFPNENCLGPGRCNMDYFRVYLMADPTYTTVESSSGESIFWRRYCYLEGCVSTELTSFNTTVPKASFPNGYPYSLDYMLFTQLSNGSLDTFVPNFSVFESTIFNLTGATGNWSDLAYKYGDFGIDKYVRTVPCAAVPCLQDCQTKFVKPYSPAELDACVEKCRGDSDPMADCIMKNTTTAGETANETTKGTTTKTQASETVAETTNAGRADNRGSKLIAESMSWGLVLGTVAIVARLMV